MEEEDSRQVLRERDVLLRLQEISKALNSELDLSRLLERIVDDAVQLTGSERGFLVLKEPGSEDWNVRVARNMDHEEVRKPGGKMSRGILTRTLSEGAVLVIQDAQTDPRFEALASVAEGRLVSVLCVPLRSKGEVFGALYFDNRHRKGLFGEGESRLLETLADQAAVAIVNARLHEDLVQKQAQLARMNEELQRSVDRLTEEYLRVQAAPSDGRAFPRILSMRQGRMTEVFALLDKVVESTLPVLIEGESGTGKELVARTIHENGPLASGRFVSENCAALSETLLESELFGHVRGAFTGADRDRKGLFELADGGTLFLDEVGEMSQGMQKKLLRALQEGEVRPLGGGAVVKVKVRVLAATNRDLKRLVSEGAFREDLYYRLAVVTLRLPPLRERREDLPLLIDHFLARFSEESGKPRRKLHPFALRAIERYAWPGNVREMENEIRRLVALGGEVLTEEDLSPHLRTQKTPVPLAEDPLMGTLEQVEVAHLKRVLAACRGNLTETAKVLGIDYSTLWRKMKRHRIR